MNRKIFYTKNFSIFLTILFLFESLYAIDLVKNLPSRNPYFTGRESYLKDLQKNLSQYGKVYLTGYGGIGKTQIAKEYSYIHEKEYDLVWWFDMRGDIQLQHENLLVHLSNSKKFKKLLNIGVKDIAPSVVVSFTNSLLEQCKYKWLLVFDNVKKDQNINLPNLNSNNQHIIITTREKPNFGKNILTISPFSNKESEQFLFKIHPKEGKEDVVGLYKALYNYPLALAQVAEEILMYENGIGSYLRKHKNLNHKNISVRSSIVQEHNDNYHKILSDTLQTIEKENRKASKVLYMLALLKTNITKKLFNSLFGSEMDDELIILNKYGMVKITNHEDSQVLNIHDIIREETVKRFNAKKTKYKKNVIFTLSKYLISFYSEKNLPHLTKLELNNNQMAPLYAFINVALKNDVINEGVVEMVIVSLKLNILRFNRYADYTLYQRLANRVYDKKIDKITPIKKAILYAHLIYSDFILESKENLLKFEKELLDLLDLIENNKNYAELFFIYTQTVQFYLLLGDLSESQKYLEKAKKYINYSDSIFSLLQYWYNNAWLCYEHRDVSQGLKSFDNYERIEGQLLSNKTNPFASINLRMKLEILSGQIDKAKKRLEKTIKNALVYYNNIPSNIIGNLEFTKASIYFQRKQYDLAYKQCNYALNITKKALGGDLITIPQANIHIMLGKIHEGKENYRIALEEYKKGLKFYNKLSYGRINNSYDYGELLSNLCTVYYKMKSYPKSRFYFQQLVTNFGLNHEIIKKLIKKFPIEYMYQIRENKERV